MLLFGSGMGSGASATVAAGEAATTAKRALGDGTPKLAIVFASISYDDAGDVPRAVREALGSDVPVVGGSAGGCLIGPNAIVGRGVTVVLLGGDGVRIATRTAALNGGDLVVDVVPRAREIARAADEAALEGHDHYTCLVFAPGLGVDGESLVAAVRKGAGPRAQLAGGLTGDDLTLDRPGVFGGDELRDDHVVLAGVFTRKPIGIAARHGCTPIGARRVVTRAENNILYELDHRPALEVWVEDARRAGATLPSDRKELALYLANHHELGFLELPQKDKRASMNNNELVIRAPLEILSDGGVKLTSAIDEGRSVQVMQTSRKDLLRASTNAAADAVLRARAPIAGALVLACSGRLAALGEEFTEEAALIRNRVAAPIGGACVYGEIAKSERDVDAFFNTTAVVVAFPA
jgi:hypothetical protein